jgi:hypothetical protein
MTQTAFSSASSVPVRMTPGSNPPEATTAMAGMGMVFDRGLVVRVALGPVLVQPAILLLL